MKSLRVLIQVILPWVVDASASIVSEDPDSMKEILQQRRIAESTITAQTARGPS